jgi:TonB family protein
MRLRTRIFPLATCLCALAATGFGSPCQAADIADGVADDVRTILVQAEQLVDNGEYERAAREFERADERAEGPCGECLLGVARAYIGMGDHKAALQITRMALPLVSSSPRLSARAYHQIGAALARGGGKNDLGPAAAALRKAVELDPSRIPWVRPDLAQVLLREGRTAEAVALARQSLSDHPRGPAAAAMRFLLCRVKAEPPIGQTTENTQMAQIAAASERVFHPGSDAVEPPVELSSPVPEQATTGTVLVQAVIDREGCVRDAKVVYSVQDDLDRAAVDAVRKWTFQPATRQGRPVTADTTLTVSFDQEGSSYR